MVDLNALTAANAKRCLTQDALKEILKYDPETGLFYWLVTRGRHARPGKLAGTPHKVKRSKSAYWRIKINSRYYLAHRLAFLYMTGTWPINQPDHKNTDTLDNRWDNLRDATPSQNQANRAARKDNKTGFKGVYFDTTSGKYRAEIQVNKKQIGLGYFENPEAASAAYAMAAHQYFGEFARVA